MSIGDFRYYLNIILCFQNGALDSNFYKRNINAKTTAMTETDSNDDRIGEIAETIGVDSRLMEILENMGAEQWRCYSDPSFPVMKCLRKDTPPEILKEFRKDQRAFRKAEKEGVLL